MANGSEAGSTAAPFIPTEHDVPFTSHVDGLPFTQQNQHPDPSIRKRAQPLDSCLSSCSIDASQPSSGGEQELDVPRRDPQFYMADGSCLLRVGNTLFNVRSSYLLMQDN